MNLENGSDSGKNEISALCDSCGVQFSCGAKNNDCWCFDLDLTKETLRRLKSDFKSCLCKNCLENVSAAENKKDAL